MKIIIVYNSKTGFTKKYAEWIAEELKCDLVTFKNFSREIIEENDLIIFGSRLSAGKIENLNKIKGYFNIGSIGKLIVFTTGATPLDATDIINKMWDNNFLKNEKETIPHFYMQSGLNYEKMGFADHTIMKMAAYFMSKKKVKSEEETAFEESIRNSYDISLKEYAMPLITYIKDNYEL